MNDYLGAESSAAAIYRHIDYVANLVGPEHVGLGLDVIFDAEPLNEFARNRPDEWLMTEEENWSGFQSAVPEEIQDLVELLVTRGYDEPTIRKILGGNMLRICGQTWLCDSA
jgi:membrane dipeptidase